MNASALPSLLRRLVAAGGAALVLALAIFAASPAAHAWLHVADHHDHGHAHHHDDAGGEDACAIVLFANGLPLTAVVAAPVPPLALAADAPRLGATEIFLVSPRYRLQPERGPPVNRAS